MKCVLKHQDLKNVSNYNPLEVVGHCSETQLQIKEGERWGIVKDLFYLEAKHREFYKLGKYCENN